MKQPSDCVETTHAKSKFGYGIATWKGKSITHHRLAWCLARNLEPAEIQGLVIRHACDNPSCVNINHLMLGTVADNVHDTHERSRANSKTGQENHQAVLTTEQVMEIRRRSQDPQKQLASEFNVNQSTVSRILAQKRWKHI